jgi:hypothetical protein
VQEPMVRGLHEQAHVVQWGALIRNIEENSEKNEFLIFDF